MINLNNNTIDLMFFQRILKELKNEPKYYLDIIDSLSPNQFKSKINLFHNINKYNILTSECNTVIMGAWYGTILVPLLSSCIQKLYCIDKNDMCTRFGKNRFFKDKTNVVWCTGDVFGDTYIDYSSINLIINTSCEHMPAMNTWPYWNNVQPGTHFAFQSNDMFTIEGHVNCVASIKEFKKQMPSNSKILLEDELTDERGTRFTLIGKIIEAVKS